MSVRHPDTGTPAAAADDVLERCAQEALALLRRNLTPAGILAATRSAAAEERRYTRIFGRDHAICALAMGLSGDTELIQGARAGLQTLAVHQADNGQIPKYVDPQGQDADFWYLGCIDATLWWLIARDLLNREAPDAAFRAATAAATERALHWLHAQEHPRLRLLQQNEASDWADIMPRSGFVLYSNALWYHVKQRYGLSHAEDTHYHVNHLFYPFSRELPDYRRLRLLAHYVRNKAEHRELYLSFVNFSFWGNEGDVFGNLLAVLFGLAESGPAGWILRALDQAGVTQPYPVRAVCRPITEDDPLWRPYMGRHQQNYPFQYHNGGIWPFIGGFWVMALAADGQRERAAAELKRLAQANALDGWAFNEWLQGETGEPRGMRGQSWNAALFLLARRAVDGGKLF